MHFVTAPLDVNVSKGLLDRLADARRRTDELFGIVKTDALYDRPIPERHRIIFYIGHLETFDWNLLSERVFGLKSVHPEFDRLFAFGIDPVGGGLPDDQPSDWPAVKNVREYGANLRQSLDEALVDRSPKAEEGQFSLHTLLNVAIEHRLMHAETLAYMLHQLPLDRKIEHPRATVHALSPVVPHMIEIPTGAATLGLPRESEKFGWDNEFEALTAQVPAFAIDQYKVTNRQYLKFMHADGYTTRSLWTEDDWNWKAAKIPQGFDPCGDSRPRLSTGRSPVGFPDSISHPAFWKLAGDQWLYRGMFHEIPLPLDAPVYVSLAEARAYARWAGKALPTEAEWHRAAYGTANSGERLYPWGNEGPNPRLGNFDFAAWDPMPVNAFPDGDSSFGVADLLGNGWEWTSTEFAPLRGFKAFPFYPGYSADFFDGKHFVLKGGSARTAACMLRRSFRNWFQPHYQYVYAGFRCVRR